MISHPARRATRVLKEHDHAITTTTPDTACKSTLRLLPTLPNSSLTSLLYLSIGYMLAEKGMIAAGLLAISCLFLKAGIYITNLITETLHEK